MDGDIICCCGCIIAIFIIFAGFSLLSEIGDTTTDDVDVSYYDDEEINLTNEEDNDSGGNGGTYVASVNSDIFHDSSCTQAKRIKGSNKITFSSRDEALNNGYTPCGICHP